MNLGRAMSLGGIAAPLVICVPVGAKSQHRAGARLGAGAGTAERSLED